MKSDYSVGGLVYDADIYDGMNTHLADLPFYMRWMPQHKDARILELCCGTGRLTFPIAEAGYDITGIDFTPSMLEQAKRKASEKGLHVTFIEADMRMLDLSEKFDLIFIPFNSIHHLYQNEDVFRTFQGVKNHLKDGGLFLLDCYNPDMRFITEAEKEQKQIAEYTTRDGRDVLIKQAMRYETSTQTNRIAWSYYINGTFDSKQNLDMRLFFPQELDTYLKWNGFHVLHKFGSFEEEAFADHSEKQIYICQKRDGPNL